MGGDPDIYTVVFDTATERFTISESGEAIGERATPGGTIAELIDRGLSREVATEKVFVASRDAWQ